MIAWLRRRKQADNEVPWEPDELAHWINQAKTSRERAQRNRNAGRRWLPEGGVHPWLQER
jgi:hypothetical protein